MVTRAEWRRLIRGTWAYALRLPGRLADFITADQPAGHGAVDVSGRGAQMRLWCMACGEPCPCAHLVATGDRETSR